MDAGDGCGWMSTRQKSDPLPGLALGQVGFESRLLAVCVFYLFLRYQLGELGGVQCLYLCYTAHSCVLTGGQVYIALFVETPGTSWVRLVA